MLNKVIDLSTQNVSLPPLYETSQAENFRETGRYFTGTHFHIESWEELVEKTKEFDTTVITTDNEDVMLKCDDFVFSEDGIVRYKHNFLFENEEDNTKVSAVEYTVIIAEKRTLDQMFEFIRALKENKQ